MRETIFVTGATGTIGAEVVRALGERHADVRAAVHSRGRDGGRHNPVPTAEFDWTSPGTWHAALDGVARVFMASPLTDAQVQQEAAFIAAARAAGVRHVLKLSVLGAGADHPGLLARWHREGELALEASGMAWTHLRPNFFMTNFVAYYPPQADGNIYLPWASAAAALIAPGDVGDVAAAALTRDDWHGSTLELTGPEALTVADVARTIAEVTGRAIRHVDVPEDAARAAMASAGMPEWLVAAMLDLHRMVRAGEAARVTHDVRAVAGHEPRRFGDFAREYARHPAWAPSRVAPERS